MNTLRRRTTGATHTGFESLRRRRGHRLALVLADKGPDRERVDSASLLASSQRSEITWLYFARRAPKLSGSPHQRELSKSTKLFA